MKILGSLFVVGAVLVLAACQGRNEKWYVISQQPGNAIVCAEPDGASRQSITIPEVTLIALTSKDAQEQAQATWERLVPAGMRLTLSEDRIQVERGSQDLALDLVAAGLAVVQPARIASTQRFGELNDVQHRAQVEHRGAWAETTNKP